jgi:Response regulator containing CheY-like receiver, AAA-type ATPase, and DNA-binding domains
MLLIQYLLYQQGKQITFTPDAVDFLHRYSWPGNIRELQAVIYRLIVLLDIDRVSLDVLLLDRSNFTGWRL